VKYFLIVIAFVLFFAKSSDAQNSSKQAAESFIEALINNPDYLVKYFDITQIKLSGRLGINYKGVKHKLLISLDIDHVIKQKLLSHELNYTYKIESLVPDYSKLLIEIPGEKINYEFLFKKGKMISKADFYAMEWTRVKSKYFVFHVSKEYLLNYYSISKLDSFVEKMLHQLACSKSEIKKLEAEKIHYFLCKDEDEIKLLTNYATRGLYYLANDYIISTFNSHCHEIAHLLLKEDPGVAAGRRQPHLIGMTELVEDGPRPLPGYEDQLVAAVVVRVEVGSVGVEALSGERPPIRIGQDLQGAVEGAALVANHVRRQPAEGIERRLQRQGIPGLAVRDDLDAVELPRLLHRASSGDARHQEKAGGQQRFSAFHISVSISRYVITGAVTGTTGIAPVPSNAGIHLL